jgi:serine/threonine protein kinase
VPAPPTQPKQNKTNPHPPSAPPKSGTVYRARVIATDAVVAVKALDLDQLATPLDDIKREVAAMRAYRHPSILPLLTSFVAGHEFFLVTPVGGGWGVGLGG